MDNVFDEVIRVYHSLTKSENKVADYILSHKAEIPHETITNLAAACHVSEATLTRFCRSLGFDSFHQFKLAAAQTMARSSVQRKSTPLYGRVYAEDSIKEKGEKLCAVSIEALQETLALLQPDSVKAAVDYLYAADNVYCFGQGNSSILAMDTWGRFTSVTAKFHWIADSHLQSATASLLTERDVILYFSFSGSTRALLELEKRNPKSGAKLILVTRYPDSPGAALADIVLICGANESPIQQGSVTAKIAQLFIVDVLFHEYSSRNLENAARNREKTVAAISEKLIGN